MSDRPFVHTSFVICGNANFMREWQAVLQEAAASTVTLEHLCAPEEKSAEVALTGGTAGRPRRLRSNEPPAERTRSTSRQGRSESGSTANSGNKRIKSSSQQSNDDSDASLEIQWDRFPTSCDYMLVDVSSRYNFPFVLRAYAKQRHIAVITASYVIECLITQKKQSVDAHPSFLYRKKASSEA